MAKLRSLLEDFFDATKTQNLPKKSGRSGFSRKGVIFSTPAKCAHDVENVDPV